MAAATAVFQALAPGDHVLVPNVMYWSLRNWLRGFATDWGLRVEVIDMADPDTVRRSLRKGETKLVWIETPANPLWTITDIAATAELAHAAGAALAVDSTVGTPVLTQPIAHGADLVMHSATKYLNGHSDVIAGALVTREDSPHWQRIRAIARKSGRHPRTVRSLASHARHAHPVSARRGFVRERAADRGALRATTIAWPRCFIPVCRDSKVTTSRAGRCAAGSAACCRSACVAAKRPPIATAARIQLWKRATSLGGVESLVEHRASVEGAGTPVPVDLLRLSVGLEDAGDLIADLEQALA